MIQHRAAQPLGRIRSLNSAAILLMSPLPVTGLLTKLMSEQGAANSTADQASGSGVPALESLAGWFGLGVGAAAVLAMVGHTVMLSWQRRALRRGRVKAFAWGNGLFNLAVGCASATLAVPLTMTGPLGVVAASVLLLPIAVVGAASSFASVDLHAEVLDLADEAVSMAEAAEPVDRELLEEDAADEEWFDAEIATVS